MHAVGAALVVDNTSAIAGVVRTSFKENYIVGWLWWYHTRMVRIQLTFVTVPNRYRLVGLRGTLASSSRCAWTKALIDH